MSGAQVIQVATILTWLWGLYGVPSDPRESPLDGDDYNDIARRINEMHSSRSIAEHLAAKHGWKPYTP